ncbi:MAG TPA: citrate/2-methylcitrate synthase [Candidatus Saccharimonadia bacterium]
MTQSSAPHPFDVPAVRRLEPVIIALSHHQGIIQSILDYDYLLGRPQPSVRAIVAGGRRMTRFFFGPDEIAMPLYATIEDVPAGIRRAATLLLCVGSGRRIRESLEAAFVRVPNLAGATVFAEGIPERLALEVVRLATERNVWVLGGASVGLIVPGRFKLGAIGGTQATQLLASRLHAPGSVAVVSSSGGMINELIRAVADTGHGLSFAAALGGERFPMLQPATALLAAQADPQTKAIVYFGELGGHDEYEVAKLIQSGALTKPVVAYIAGSVAELFEIPPQFGHAKAIAQTADESARAKADALAAAGARVGRTYAEFVELIRALPPDAPAPAVAPAIAERLTGRRPALISATISGDDDGVVKIIGQDQLALAQQHSFAYAVTSMFLGHPIKSAKLEAFVDFVLRLLVDNGPYVSGAINTVTAARAGKDLVSSLAAGLLTIGPRFGGAINQAASTWLISVNTKVTPAELVERSAHARKKLAGIGHRKYRIDMPDPRVEPLLRHALALPKHPYTDYALAVQALTTRKKGNLILNVDGAIAAVLLDLLAQEEGYSPVRLQALVDIEFFNALFVLSRSVGFMAHYFDQVRLDEGLLRLTLADVAHLDLPPVD